MPSVACPRHVIKDASKLLMRLAAVVCIHHADRAATSSEADSCAQSWLLHAGEPPGVVEMRGASFSWASRALAGVPDAPPDGADEDGKDSGKAPGAARRAFAGFKSSVGNVAAMRGGGHGGSPAGDGAATGAEAESDLPPQTDVGADSASGATIVGNIGGSRRSSAEMHESTSSCLDDTRTSSRPPPRAPPLALDAPTFRIEPGELVGVCGAVGAGKSALLAANLGELQPLPQAGYVPGDAIVGAPVVTGGVALCQQLPWIEAGTVRENILFGSAYEAEWCAFSPF
jgi:ABC-type multidrug transport system fused ATPase/permease subunit